MARREREKMAASLRRLQGAICASQHVKLVDRRGTQATCDDAQSIVGRGIELLSVLYYS